MTRNSTLIYQFINNEEAQIYNLQELLEDEYLLKNKLKNLQKIRIKSPQVEIIRNLKV